MFVKIERSIIPDIESQFTLFAQRVRQFVSSRLVIGLENLCEILCSYVFEIFAYLEIDCVVLLPDILCYFKFIEKVEPFSFVCSVLDLYYVHHLFYVLYLLLYRFVFFFYALFGQDDWIRDSLGAVFDQIIH